MLAAPIGASRWLGTGVKRAMLQRSVTLPAIVAEGRRQWQRSMFLRPTADFSRQHLPYSTRIQAGKASRLPIRRRRSLSRDEASRSSAHEDTVQRQIDHQSNSPYPIASTNSSLQPPKSSETHVELPARTSPSTPAPHVPEGKAPLVTDRRQSIESILGQPSIIVTREVEMLNIFMGYEQANKYAIVAPDGTSIGFLAESERGMMGGTLKRQFLRTHRSFEAHVLDTQGRVIMTFERPTTLINSRLKIYLGGDPRNVEDKAQLVGEVHQIWHPFRRKYELFVNQSEVNENGDGEREETMMQFASIDGPLLTWNFVLNDENKRPLGAISRNFRGFGRELFTDTGQYVLSFDPTSTPNLQLEAPDTLQQSQKPKQDNEKDQIGTSTSGRELIVSGPARTLSLEERAVALATAVSVDFDYFSQHSHSSHHGGFMPWFWGGGGGGGANESPPAETPEGTGMPPVQDGNEAGTVQQPNNAESTTAQGGLPQQSPDYPDWQQPQQQQTPWWASDEVEQSPAAGQEDVWGGAQGDADPWKESQPDSDFGDGGASDGWGWTDFLPGGGDG